MAESVVVPCFLRQTLGGGKASKRELYPPERCALTRAVCGENLPGHLAPDDADLGAAGLLRGAVDESDALAVVEGGVGGVLDTLCIGK